MMLEIALLKSSSAAGCVIAGEADDGFAVVNFVGGDESEGLGERDAEDLNLLVCFGLGDAFSDVAREVDLHVFGEEAGAGEVLGEKGPALGAEAGFFDHLALGGGEGGFVGLDAPGWEFEEELACSMAILALEDNVGVFGVFGVIYGEDDDRAIVADDVAYVAVAGGLDDGVGEDFEDFAVVREL